MIEINVPDQAAMEYLGKQLAAVTPAGSSIYLQGDLGAGKTTLSRGFLNGFGHPGIVKSPTYTLVEPYQVNGIDIFHFDLYRLNDPEELDAIGIRDYFTEDSICLVEWPEKASDFLGLPDVHTYINYAGEHRNVSFEAKSETGKTIIQGF